ncbi:MAG: hypothetical protein HZB50_05095 [Chloroflexi bacterium]|nr:hypothetical protein [Chloroflexota bacterium]
MPRINFMFVLIIFLTACTSNATLAPLPTVTLSPVVSEVATMAGNIVIANEPAGFGLMPGSPDTVIEQFVEPTTEDAKLHMSGEAEPPEKIKEEVALIKAEMEKNKDKVAEICVVPVDQIKTVFKEGSVGNEYRWTVVYEAGKYTCWANVAATGKLGEYPTYFDKTTKKLKSEDEGISWERVEGHMDWAGTVPVLLNGTKYIIPEGLSGTEIGRMNNWSALVAGGTAEVFTTPAENPFSPEQWSKMNEAGYLWDVSTGSLVKDGFSAFHLVDGKLVDSSGIESSFESLKLVETSGVDYDGNPIVVMMVRGEKEDKKMYIPTSGEWVKPIDVAANQAFLEKNDFVRTQDNYKDEVKIDYNEIPLIEWSQYEDGTLFWSTQLALKPWPKDVLEEPFWIGREGVNSNVWTLKVFPTGDYDEDLFGKQHLFDRPLVTANDPVKIVSAFRVFDPNTKKEVIIKGQQYHYKGKSFILELIFSDDFAKFDDTTGAYSITQSSLVDPSRWVNSPVVNLRPGDPCNPGGRFNVYPNTACAIQNNLALPVARTLLPDELQEKMAAFDNIELSGNMPRDNYLVGDWVYLLQQYLFPSYSVAQSAAYFLSEDDPMFDGIFPHTP